MANVNIETLRQRIHGQAEPVQPMRQQRAEIVGVTAGEIRAACEANPNHALAAVLRRSTRPYPDGHRLYVEKPDLLALLDDAEVVVEESLEDTPAGKVRVVRKTLRAKPAARIPAKTAGSGEPVAASQKSGS